LSFEFNPSANSFWIFSRLQGQNAENAPEDENIIIKYKKWLCNGVILHNMLELQIKNIVKSISE
jgi:hypothetical protein